MERYAYCNWVVIAITCWVSYLGFRNRGFETDYFFWPEAILARKQYYRLITPGFLHLDTFHLVMNMVSLYFFGPLIETIFGPVQFLVIYLGAIVAGNLLALWIHRHHDYRALGASGGVCGIIFAYILYFPHSRINPYLLPMGIPAAWYAVVFLLASFYGMQRQLTNVGHDAHLGGALAGMFAAAALHPSAIYQSPWLFAGVSLGTALLFIYMARRPLFTPLEGFDFTKETRRPIKLPGRFSPRRLFARARRSRPDSAEAVGRPDRRVDAILRKISSEGLHSLTAEERKLMDETSEKYRRRASQEKPKSIFPF
ncbi:MAG TPA: rhomboid family intramembrane serine protease [Verrucomicrobiae bacterium]|jgi:membrane associated rhomboid family serine protease